MAELKQGMITLEVPDEVIPPEMRGIEGPVEASQIPRTPGSLAHLCEQAATSLERAGDRLPRLAGVTPYSLRHTAFQLRTLERLTHDAEAALSVLRQMYFLYQAGAYEKVKELYDYLKDQGRPSPEISSLFLPILDFFARVLDKHEDCPDPDEPIPLKTSSDQEPR